MQTLLDNQIGAIEKIQRYKVGALFMEMGTGKTRTAYELIKSVECDGVVWLTPFQNKSNILAEIEKWGGLELLNIYGIETLSSSDRVYLEVTKLLAEGNYFLVVDESLKIKNFDAIRTRRIIELGKLCEYKLILNGTPLTRNLLDVWAQFEFLSPKILNMGLAEFKNTFCEYTTITKRIGHKEMTKEFISKYHNVEHLYSMIFHYVYECDLRLSVKQEYKDESYSLSEEEMDRYQFIKEKYLDNEKLQFLNNNIFLELTQKMQHDYCISEGKFELLDQILSKVDKSKVLIYTKYIASREEITKRYPSIKVLSYGMHSFGLNLQDYNTTIYFDKTFDYSQMIQSRFRTYRTGQELDCTYYSMTGNVGLERMINENINKKQSLLDYFKQVGVEQIKKEL
jgi:SNF2 family DNA or RNA helicase